MLTNPTYQFIGDPEDEGDWRAFVTANSTITPTKERRSTIRAIYELLIVVIAIGVVVGTVFWRHTTARLSALETEIHLLEEAISTASSSSTPTQVPSDVHPEEIAKSLRTTQTDHFRFIFEPAYMNSVTSAAARLDKSYVDLRTDLGLPTAVSQDVPIITIFIKPHGYSTDSDESGQDGEESQISADLHIYKQLAWTDEHEQEILLYNDLFGQLAKRSLDEVISSYQIEPQWEVITHYLYIYVMNPQSPKIGDLMPSYKLQRRHTVQAWSIESARLRIEPGNSIYPDSAWAYDIADPLVEYILYMHGRSVIPALFAALSMHDDWVDVVPAVFDIPAEQFEAEWHEYLAEHYPIEESVPNQQ